VWWTHTLFNALRIPNRLTSDDPKFSSWDSIVCSSCRTVPHFRAANRYSVFFANPLAVTVSNSISFYYGLNKCFRFEKKKCFQSLKLPNLLLLFRFNKVTWTDKRRGTKTEQAILYATKPVSFTKSASFARMAETSSACVTTSLCRRRIRTELLFLLSVLKQYGEKHSSGPL
jgi:hypothetical protein